jgi:hypothetical protein
MIAKAIMPHIIKSVCDHRCLFLRHARDKAGHDELRALTRKASMTAYLIALSLAGLVAIAVWEGFS